MYGTNQNRINLISMQPLSIGFKMYEMMKFGEQFPEKNVEIFQLINIINNSNGNRPTLRSVFVQISIVSSR